MAGGQAVSADRREQGTMQLTPPAALAVAAAGAKISILCWQCGRLDLVDGVGVGVLRRDGRAALALAD